MSTDTPNEIKHCIKQLNQISAQCEQNNYSTKTKCFFFPLPVPYHISDELHFLLMKDKTTTTVRIHNKCYKYNRTEMKQIVLILKNKQGVDLVGFFLFIAK